MKIAYASDLHLEFNPAYEKTVPEADVLVLAGDVEVRPYSYGYFLRGIRETFSGPIVAVMGNHEYYHGDFYKSLSRLKDALADIPDFYLLEKEEVTLSGVRFLGATLWSDLAKGTQAENCRGRMNDYRIIAGTEGSSLTPEETLEAHSQTLDWLEESFKEPSEAPAVLVTHFAPSYLSQHPRFSGSPISGGFCSSLDAQILRWRPNVIIHGHVHDEVDYIIGDTRVVCNPWGYPKEGNPHIFKTLEV
jgi:Icc-related predicted phosphoesterase